MSPALVIGLALKHTLIVGKTLFCLLPERFNAVNIHAKDINNPEFELVPSLRGQDAKQLQVTNPDNFNYPDICWEANSANMVLPRNSWLVWLIIFYYIKVK